MAGANFTITDEVKQEFIQMKTGLGQFRGWIQVKIDFDNDQLVLGDSGDQTDDCFGAINSGLPEGNHAFYVMKSPLDQSKFLLVHWGPDGAAVKERMIYASSRQNLKEFLGSSDFTDDYFISTAEEMSLDFFTKSRVDDPNIDVRSYEEIEREQANHETAPTVTKSAVMAQLAVNVHESTHAALAAFSAGDCNTVLISLDTKSQEIQSAQVEGESFDSMTNELSPENAAFVLHRYQHLNRDNDESTTNIFFYFCPDDADRRAKFTYSMCKANVISVVKEFVELEHTYEFMDVQDMNAEYFLNDLYPLEVVREEIVRPKAPGRKKGRRGRRGKLNLDQE